MNKRNREDEPPTPRPTSHVQIDHLLSRVEIMLLQHQDEVQARSEFKSQIQAEVQKVQSQIAPLLCKVDAILLNSPPPSQVDAILLNSHPPSQASSENRPQWGSIHADDVDSKFCEACHDAECLRRRSKPCTKFCEACRDQQTAATLPPSGSMPQTSDTATQRKHFDAQNPPRVFDDITLCSMCSMTSRVFDDITLQRDEIENLEHGVSLLAERSACASQQNPTIGELAELFHEHIFQKHLDLIMGEAQASSGSTGAEEEEEARERNSSEEMYGPYSGRSMSSTLNEQMGFTPDEQMEDDKHRKLAQKAVALQIALHSARQQLKLKDDQWMAKMLMKEQARTSMPRASVADADIEPLEIPEVPQETHPVEPDVLRRDRTLGETQATPPAVEASGGGSWASNVDVGVRGLRIGERFVDYSQDNQWTASCLMKQQHEDGHSPSSLLPLWSPPPPLVPITWVPPPPRPSRPVPESPQDTQPDEQSPPPPSPPPSPGMLDVRGTGMPRLGEVVLPCLHWDATQLDTSFEEAARAGAQASTGHDAMARHLQRQATVLECSSEGSDCTQSRASCAEGYPDGQTPPHA